MANRNVDLIDVGPLAVFPVMAALALGAISLEFTLFGGFSFTDALYSGSGVVITTAGVLATVSAVLIVVTNELLNSKELPDDDATMYAYIVGIIVVFGVVPLFMLMPAVRDLVASYDVVNAGLLLAQGAGVTYVAWYR
jgi:uncharacterized membrane protein